MNRALPSTRATLLAYFVCAFVWGTTWFAIRVCIGPGGYPTLLAAALRFTLASLLIAPIAWRARPRPAGRVWAWLILAGVLDACGYALVYLGEERVPGGLAAVLFGTQPLLLAVLLTATRMEKILVGDVVGALVSIAGVGIIFMDRLDVSATQAVGVALVLGSVLVSTLYAMIMKRHGEGVHAFASTGVFIAVTAVCLWIAALVHGGGALPWPPPIEPTLALVYLAVFGSIVAFATYFWLLSRVSLMTMSTLSFIIPIVALLVDAAFEAQQLRPRAYLGIGIALSGLAVSVMVKRSARATAPTVAPVPAATPVVTEL